MPAARGRHRGGHTTVAPTQRNRGSVRSLPRGRRRLRGLGVQNTSDGSQVAIFGNVAISATPSSMMAQ
jgi:hypothetical protein